MRTFLRLVLPIVLVACGPADEQAEGSASGTSTDSPAASYWDEYGGSTSACDRQRSKVTLDGRTFDVPALCNPYWMDKGDPPPDRTQSVGDRIRREVLPSKVAQPQ